MHRALIIANHLQGNSSRPAEDATLFIAYSACYLNGMPASGTTTKMHSHSLEAESWWFYAKSGVNNTRYILGVRPEKKPEEKQYFWKRKAEHEGPDEMHPIIVYFRAEGAVADELTQMPAQLGRLMSSYIEPALSTLPSVLKPSVSVPDWVRNRIPAAPTLPALPSISWPVGKSYNVPKLGSLPTGDYYREFAWESTPGAAHTEIVRTIKSKKISQRQKAVVITRKLSEVIVDVSVELLPIPTWVGAATKAVAGRVIEWTASTLLRRLNILSDEVPTAVAPPPSESR